MAFSHKCGRRSAQLAMASMEQLSAPRTDVGAVAGASDLSATPTWADKTHYPVAAIFVDDNTGVVTPS